MNRHLQPVDCQAAISHHLSLTLMESLLFPTREAFSQLEQLLLYGALVLVPVLLSREILHCVVGHSGQRPMDATAPAAEGVVPQVDAEATDDNNLHTHNLFRSAQERIGAGNRIADVGVDNILLVVCSLLGCILRMVGTWGLVAAGTRHS